MRLLLAAAAAFCTYFCMYAFRKPFTSATFEGEEVFGFQLKAALILAQILGYMFSKFLGIKIISELGRQYRSAAILGLIAVAQVALVGFAFVPTPLKVLMMFINGLPLGMVFGLVLGYLEGRRQTEALAAALCASFIASSGFVKSVGQWLMQGAGISEFHMPMVAGLLFVPPLLLSVWLLHATPPPDDADKRLRRERNVMDGELRRQFLAAYWPGLTLLVFVYVALTVIRTIRDDFAVEIWRELGASQSPSVFARAEILVAILVTTLNALAILIHDNLRALRVTMVLMCGAFAVVGGSVLLHQTGRISSFGFMVACGVGLYVPYVAYHTTVFERLIAVSRRPCNLGFLMYVADAVGYLGYSVVVTLKTVLSSPADVLPFFLRSMSFVAAISVIALLLASFYFEKVLANGLADSSTNVSPVEEFVPVE